MKLRAWIISHSEQLRAWILSHGGAWILLHREALTFVGLSFYLGLLAISSTNHRVHRQEVYRDDSTAFVCYDEVIPRESMTWTDIAVAPLTGGALLFSSLLVLIMVTGLVNIFLPSFAIWKDEAAPPSHPKRI